MLGVGGLFHLAAPRTPHIMHPSTAVLFFFEFSRTAFSTCVAGVVLLVIGIMTAKDDIERVDGLEKVVALSNLCFAAPLAVFAAEHFSAAQGISQIVPKFMPWPLFWTYLVGAALLTASLSIALKRQVFWSGLLFGVMMFLFVTMMDVPGTVADIHNRISWTLMFRELSFGAGGWMLAAAAMDAQQVQGKRALITFGSVVIGITAVLYGVENFLHPLNVPGVPLEKMLPAWIPAKLLIGYLTSAILVVAGIGILLPGKTKAAATYLGSWIVLLVVIIYGPILIVSLLDPSTAVKVEGINYFFDTLLYAGTVLALAKAAPPGLSAVPQWLSPALKKV
jgi:uncharacterized membrane protein